MEPIFSGTFKRLETRMPRFAFPACAIIPTGSSYQCCLNKYAQEILDEDMGSGCWYNAEKEEYMIFMPSKSLNAYKPIIRRGHLEGYSFPIDGVRKYGVKVGHYRINRYKSGFCFKYTKRLEDE